MCVGILTLSKGVMLTIDDVSGTVTLQPLRLYENTIQPLYRMLGLDTVIPCAFSGLKNTLTGRETADRLFAPLKALIDSVQTQPDVCRALVEFYRSGEAAAVHPSAETPVWNVTMHIDSFTISAKNSLINAYVKSIQKMIANTLSDTTVSMESAALTYCINASSLYEQLTALTYTESAETEKPTQPDTPAVPETPDPAASSATSEKTFLRQILDFFSRIVSFFRQLFR